VASSNVTGFIEKWMLEFGAQNGYELSRTEFIKEGDAWYLRVFVDKLDENGYASMGTDDCEAVSRFLSEKLDEADPIRQNYYLEVSSPGLDRPLLKESDFARFKGHEIDVRLYKAFNGQKKMHGVLKNKDENYLDLTDMAGCTHRIPSELVSSVRLTVIF